MASLRDYFDVDSSRVLTANVNKTASNADGVVLGEILGKLAFDFDALARFWYFYIPSTVNQCEVACLILHDPQTAAGSSLPDGGDSFEVESGFENSTFISSKELVFTRKVTLYLEADLDDDAHKKIMAAAKAAKLVVDIRDKKHAASRAKFEKPVAFISHDSKDKDFARQLAVEMTRLSCPVWFDEFTLKIGDDLRAKIEKGLKEAKRCILIISPDYIRNERWASTEFESIFNRELMERTKVILPLWHNVEADEVYHFCTMLTGRFARKTDEGAAKLASELVNVIRAVE